MLMVREVGQQFAWDVGATTQCLFYIYFVSECECLSVCVAVCVCTCM